MDRPPTSDPFTDLCTELLAPLGRVQVRRMFGGRGFYVDGVFMALIAGGEFFLKTDATTRERFAAVGSEPFTFEHKDGERVVTSYCRPPEEALESPALMLPWARLAMEAALRAANAKAKKPARAAKAPASTPREGAAKKAATRKAPAKKAAARRG